MTQNRKFDQTRINDNITDYIAVACHYDEYTLLTKNGHLLQTIAVTAIDLDHQINIDLSALRANVRDAISAMAKTSPDYAAWIHTIRSAALLDEPIEYENKFISELHNKWVERNNWGRFPVNNLYITIVHKVEDFVLYKPENLVKTLASDALAKDHKTALEKAASALTLTTDKLISALAQYKAVKLGIIFLQDGTCHSQSAQLYQQILHLSNKAFELSIADISAQLASVEYHINSSMMEVHDQNKIAPTKYANIISLKEYHELSDENVNNIIQLPCSMIITEIFYLVPQKEIKQQYQEQKELLETSKDQSVLRYKNFDTIFNEEASSRAAFCRYQISILIFDEDPKRLEAHKGAVSNLLNKYGLVHINEDIDLEKSFWAQLPGNFAFLARMQYNTTDQVAGFASLYNLPLGNFSSPWGRVHTMFKTTIGAPYFFNLQDARAAAKLGILGASSSGKTTLLNFLTAGTHKYKAHILHITNNHSSDLYAKALGAKILPKSLKVINPFLCTDTQENRAMILEFLRIILQHYYAEMTSEESIIIEKLVDYIFQLAPQERILSLILNHCLENMLDKKDNSGLAKRASYYLEGGEYYQFFESDEQITWNAQPTIISYNLSYLNEDEYSTQNYPRDSKLVTEFQYKLNVLKDVKAAGIFALYHLLLTSQEDGAKLIAIDEILELIDIEKYNSFIPALFLAIDSTNASSIITISLNSFYKAHERELPLEWLQALDTQILLPSDVTPKDNYDAIGITRDELQAMTQAVRSGHKICAIKQDASALMVDFDLTGLGDLKRILSCDDKDIELLANLLSELAPEDRNDVNKWLHMLYQKFNQALN
jgi:type IV secretion system protein VirB4